ncbi:hypothetical protein BKA62DRAFT_37941 [Auriculariales sp. MPI-PUGE-AT-0066]|nr:hypothetical protein BKA62DRAFT_37941 [Auriculariales sp. MPI-PUGE-AT-0066]
MRPSWPRSKARYRWPPPDILLPPQQDDFAERKRQEGEHKRQEDERVRAEETRREHALEELARRRQAQENSAKVKRAADGRKVAKTNYQKSWDSVHHELKAYASATPFLAADRPAALHFETFPWPLYGPPPRDLAELSRDRIVEFVYDGIGGFVASTDVTAWSRPGPTPRKSYESGSGGSHSHAEPPAVSTSPPPTSNGAAPVQPNHYHLFPEPGSSATRAGPSHSHTNSYGSGAAASSSALPYLGGNAAGPSSGSGFTGTFNGGFNAGYSSSARPTGSFAGIGAGSGNYAGVGAGGSAYAGPSGSASDKYASPTGTIMLGAAPGSANYAPSGSTPPLPPPPPPKDMSPALPPPSSYFPPVDGRRSADPHRDRERETPRPDVSNLSRSPEDEQARRNAVKATLKLWTGAPDGKGGDKFAARLMKIIEPSSRDAVLEGHAVVVRTLLSELVTLD